LAVDIICPVDALKQPVERFEPGVILPTVDILVIEGDDILAESVDGIASNTGLASSRWAIQEWRFGPIPVDDRTEGI
jgi:hypothetical protein